VSVDHMHALFQPEVERKLTPAINYFLGLFRGSNPLSRPGETSQNPMQFGPPGGHDLPKALPQVEIRERAAHTRTVSEHAFGQIGQNSRGNSNGFRS
jgi:hypothetical protein